MDKFLEAELEKIATGSEFTPRIKHLCVEWEQEGLLESLAEFSSLEINILQSFIAGEALSVQHLQALWIIFTDHSKITTARKRKRQGLN